MEIFSIKINMSNPINKELLEKAIELKSFDYVIAKLEIFGINVNDVTNLNNSLLSLEVNNLKTWKERSDYIHVLQSNLTKLVSKKF